MNRAGWFWTSTVHVQNHPALFSLFSWSENSLSTFSARGGPPLGNKYPGVEMTLTLYRCPWWDSDYTSSVPSEKLHWVPLSRYPVLSRFPAMHFFQMQIYLNASCFLHITFWLKSEENEPSDTCTAPEPWPANWAVRLNGPKLSLTTF